MMRTSLFRVLKVFLNHHSLADKVEQPIIPAPYNSPGAIAPITIDQSPPNQHRQEYIGQFRQQLFYDELEQNYF